MGTCGAVAAGGDYRGRCRDASSRATRFWLRDVQQRDAVRSWRPERTVRVGARPPRPGMRWCSVNRHRRRAASPVPRSPPAFRPSCPSGIRVSEKSRDVYEQQDDVEGGLSTVPLHEIRSTRFSARLAVGRTQYKHVGAQPGSSRTSRDGVALTAAAWRTVVWRLTAGSNVDSREGADFRPPRSRRLHRPSPRLNYAEGEGRAAHSRRGCGRLWMGTGSLVSISVVKSAERLVGAARRARRVELAWGGASRQTTGEGYYCPTDPAWHGRLGVRTGARLQASPRRRSWGPGRGAWSSGAPDGTGQQTIACVGPGDQGLGWWSLATPRRGAIPPRIFRASRNWFGTTFGRLHRGTGSTEPARPEAARAVGASWG